MLKSILSAALFLLAAQSWAQLSCDEATPITYGQHECELIAGAIGGLESCGPSGATNANWFSFVAPEDATLLLTTSLTDNAGWDSDLSLFSGSCDAMSCVGSDDDGGSGFLSTFMADVEAGVQYFISLDNTWSSSSGLFYVGLEEDVENFVESGGGGGGGGGGTTDVPTVFIDFESTDLNTGFSECVVDMNGDNLDDIVSPSGSFVTIHYQQPDGTYTSETIPGDDPDFGPSWSICAGDLDANGYNDLVYGGGQGVSIMMRSDDGDYFTEFTTDNYVFSQRSNMVDINNDGMLDAFVCHDVDPNVYFINNGDGTFEFIQGGLGDTQAGGNYGSIWTDYNNDGMIDMFIAKCGADNINQMHRNNGDGTYTEVGEEINLNDGVQTWSSSWGDFDNDGDMDVFVGASSSFNGSHVMKRNDDGMFTDITVDAGALPNLPTGIENVAHDFNNDGYLDVKLSGSTFLMNNGDMTFTHTGSIANSGAVGDLNNDGFLDILTGTAYLNVPNDNNWIKINTIGTESNINGIGSRITITTALGTQIRDVKSGDGFARMGSLMTHFGLGADTEIESIVVAWPSGWTTTVENPDINQTLNIVEVDDEIVDGIAEVAALEVSVFPNPTSDYINIAADFNVNSIPCEIVDMNGKVVVSKMIKENRIDVSALATGVYHLRLLINGTAQQTKFVKQ